MSTILDALRKLQGDRDGVAPPKRDLRASVLDTTTLPPLRIRRTEPKVRPLIASLGGGAAVAACLVGLFLFLNGREADPFERAASAEMPADPTLMAQADVPPSPPAEAALPRVPEPLVNMAAPPQPLPDSSVSPEARYGAPAFEQPQPEPEAAPSNQPWFTPPATFAPALERARPSDDDVHLEGSSYASTPQSYEPPQIVTRSDSQQPAEPVELENAMARARERLAQSETPSQRPRRERSARQEPPRDPSQDGPPVAETPETLATTGVEFPSLEVQSVLWHPDPLRRQATILLDGQLATDAREGDMIGGVFVDSIKPGSVEFRMGQERKRVDMAP